MNILNQKKYIEDYKNKNSNIQSFNHFYEEFEKRKDNDDFANLFLNAAHDIIETIDDYEMTLCCLQKIRKYREYWSVSYSYKKCFKKFNKLNEGTAFFIKELDFKNATEFYCILGDIENAYKCKILSNN